YQATLHHFDEKYNILYAAGAPEAIIRLSKFVHADGKEEISEKLFKELISKYENLSKKGLRIVSAAYKKIPASREEINKDDLNNFVLIGFIALKDPIRPEVKQAVDDCRQAGIRIIIITGDHKFTAKAISEELGIPALDSEIIEGPELEKMSGAELEKKIGKVKIFARSSPQQKLRVVEALQKRGEIAAMTGDGVNDAPALKKADIGVVLGSGTDVAKETGDLILLNNSFAVIVSAIKQGRIIFDNLKKIVIYILADSFTEVLLIGAALFSGMPSPLLPAQILWVNLVEDSLPAFSLAFEKGERDILNMPPRGMKSAVWDFEVKTFTAVITCLNAGVLFGIYWVLNKNGFSLEHIRTIVFCGIGANALLYVFSCRSLRVPIWKLNPFENKYLVFSSLLGIALLFAAVYIPFLRWILKTEPLGIFEWSLVFGLGLLNIATIEAIKLLMAYRKK
ncbi:MAG: HAD-IC family P-type ATPase, partial [Patescibacteria group bacterium]